MVTRLAFSLCIFLPDVSVELILKNDSYWPCKWNMINKNCSTLHQYDISKDSVCMNEHLAAKPVYIIESHDKQYIYIYLVKLSTTEFSTESFKQPWWQSIFRILLQALLRMFLLFFSAYGASSWISRQVVPVFESGTAPSDSAKYAITFFLNKKMRDVDRNFAIEVYFFFFY